MELERDSAEANPLIAESIDADVHVRPEDKHAIAVWVSDNNWSLISLTLEQVELVKALRSQLRRILGSDGDIDADGYRSTVATAINRIDETLEIIDAESHRLGSQVVGTDLGAGGS